MFPVKDNIPVTKAPLVTVGLIVANVVVYILAIWHGGGFFSGPDLQEVFKYGAIPDALTHGGAHCVQATAGWWSYPPLSSVHYTPASGHAVLAAAHTPFAAHPANFCAAKGTGLPAMNTTPSGLTIFTALFMHASLIHLAGNMLFLWMFGNSVEQSLGRIRYLLLYVIAGVAALALEVAVAPHSAAPTLGSSGAVAGVLGAYLVLYPRGKVLAVVFIFLFFTVIELPLWLMLGAWVAEQAAFGATNLVTPAGGRDAIAYFGYVGGFVFGLIVVRLLARYLHPPQPPTAVAAA